MKLRYQASVSLNEEEALLLEQIPQQYKPKEIFLIGVETIRFRHSNPANLHQDALQDTISYQDVQSIDTSHVSQEPRPTENPSQVSHDSHTSNNNS